MSCDLGVSLVKNTLISGAIIITFGGNTGGIGLGLAIGISGFVHDYVMRNGIGYLGYEINNLVGRVRELESVAEPQDPVNNPVADAV